MNNNHSHHYENYVNSYGMQEIRREAGVARMLKKAGLGRLRVENPRQTVMRFAGIVIVVSLIVFFFVG